MPLICPSATRMPTPVKNPINTVRERKSARNPRRMRRARIKKPAVINASTPANATYSPEPWLGEHI